MAHHAPDVHIPSMCIRSVGLIEENLNLTEDDLNLNGLKAKVTSINWRRTSDPTDSRGLTRPVAKTAASVESESLATIKLDTTVTGLNKPIKLPLTGLEDEDIQNAFGQYSEINPNNVQSEYRKNRLIPIAEHAGAIVVQYTERRVTWIFDCILSISGKVIYRLGQSVGEERFREIVKRLQDLPQHVEVCEEDVKIKMSGQIEFRLEHEHNVASSDAA